MIFESLVNFALISLTLSFSPPDHYLREYPTDYDPDSEDPERMTFDGIYERRKKFDVETPMEFPSESRPESEELYNDRIHSSDPNYSESDSNNDYNMQSTDGNNPNDDYTSSESQSDPKSFLTDGCLRCLCEVFI